MKTEILQNFLKAQERTKERITLEFTPYKTVEFWHFFEDDKIVDSFSITSEDLSLEEFNTQMVEYLLKNC